MYSFIDVMVDGWNCVPSVAPRGAAFNPSWHLTYVRKVVDTVNEFDNVLYEICNENSASSTPWQYDMIRFIKDHERTKPKQHPVGMTFQYGDGNNQQLYASPADWISPGKEGGYRDNPPASTGDKVILSDTDHLWGLGGNVPWVWKSFLRGLNPIFMDRYDGKVLQLSFPETQAEAMRKAMGQVLHLSRRVDLAAMTPRNGIASSKFCLADPGKEYLIYAAAAASNITVKLPAGAYAVSWLDLVSGTESGAGTIQHDGGARNLSAPNQRDSLLHVRRSP